MESFEATAFASLLRATLEDLFLTGAKTKLANMVKSRRFKMRSLAKFGFGFGFEFEIIFEFESSSPLIHDAEIGIISRSLALSIQSARACTDRNWPLQDEVAATQWADVK